MSGETFEDLNELLRQIKKAAATVKGRRIDASAKNEAGHTIPWLEPGDYGKDFDGLWYCRPPWEHASGCLGNGTSHHKVAEHEDGTITVSPSILITVHLEKGMATWHGFLERGVWRQC